ncbi:MAG: hypothetical protein EZS28_035392 [Streblomastix strix]|uniref:Uncharacterized protein n=1 Tax=Streblomastix strix TaxID=222440 RepID=A0A5J4UG70_9EUKA|nr:MAG: hypothetical protein EZS28_035392 [Streblomastix strix]
MLFGSFLQATDDEVYQILSGTKLVEILNYIFENHPLNQITDPGFKSTPFTDPHPYFDEFEKLNRTQDLYKLFSKRSGVHLFKDKTTISIGCLYRSQEIPDNKMRKDIIDSIKTIAKDEVDREYQKEAIQVLKGLSMNEANRMEIEENDFIITESQDDSE